MKIYLGTYKQFLYCLLVMIRRPGQKRRGYHRSAPDAVGYVQRAAVLFAQFPANVQADSKMLIRPAVFRLLDRKSVV